MISMGSACSMNIGANGLCGNGEVNGLLPNHHEVLGDAQVGGGNNLTRYFEWHVLCILDLIQEASPSCL